MRIFSENVFLDGAFTPACVEFDAARFLSAEPGPGPADVNFGSAFVVPGLVDIHTHGAAGEDFSDGSPDGLPALSRHYASHGVTSFLASVMTLKEPALTRAVRTVRDFVRPADGAKCAGIHLEGPFLSHARRGAQAAENLCLPDTAMFHRLNRESGGQIRLVTVAPELPGAIPFIEEVSKLCTVALGHTDADYETAMAAFQAGASHVTHLFNAMPPLLHRAPGVIGAALDSGATVELICDGLHVHPSAVRLAVKAFGGQLAAVSDSLRCTGMPEGEYELGGQTVELKDGRACLLHTDTLAGSTADLLSELRNLVSFGIPLEQALTAVTLTPARAVRLDGELGSIAEGKRADFAVLDRDLNLLQVFADGTRLL